MAVANPCLQNWWDAWMMTKMEENRRKPLIERLHRWLNVEGNVEEEEDGVEDEGDKDEDVSEDEGIGEVKEEEGDGECDAERGLKEHNKGDEEEEEEVVEEEEEEEENEVEGEVEENEEVGEEEEQEVKEATDTEEEEESEVKGEDREMEEVDEEENEVEGEANEDEEVGEEEEQEVKEAMETEEEEESEVNVEVREIEEVDEEENEVEEVGEEERREVEEANETEEEEVQAENEASIEGEASEEEISRVRREKQIEEEEEEDDEEEEEQKGGYHPEEQFEEVMRRIHQEAAQEDDDLYSEDSENQYFNWESPQVEDQYVEKQDEDEDELKDPDEESLGNESGVFGAWSTQGKNEEEVAGKKLRDRKETAAEYWAIQEDFKSLLEEEEESSQSEEEDLSVDEDEDEVKTYCKDDYPTHVFLTLNEFRDSSLLTDLTLSTEDGRSLRVHSPVLAAVSSMIWRNLRVGNNREDDEDGVHGWSVRLGPEVDGVGLEAIVEFAYTGLIPRLSEDNVDQIKAAARTMRAPRVLELCAEEEERSTKTGGKKKKEKISTAQQMMTNLQFIKHLWTDRVGCDVTLDTLGASLHVHRVILAVSSDYFRGMFTSGMKESHQPRVTLPFLLASELELLIGCSYSGTLPLSWKCVFEITSIALQLQYQPALSLCLTFLHQEMNPHSCLDVVSFAEAYEMAPLLEAADDFVLRQFPKVAFTSKFKDLPAKQLLKYLNSRSLCVPSELVVFKAVVSWIQAKPRPRLRLAKALMKTIHFPLMTFKEFKEVQSQDMWSDHSLTELYEAIFEDFCSSETAVQNQCRVYLPKESLVLIGGDQISEDLDSRSISKDLWFGNSLRNHTGIKKAMEWRKLGEMPEPGRFCHEVAVVRGQLYVFGGKKYYGIDDTLNSVYRYDPLQDSWECLAKMRKKRCLFSVVVLDGKMIAIGGRCDPEYVDSVEQYCPTTNTWSFTWPLDLPLGCHVARVFQGQIFVSGGQNSDYPSLSSMFLYHPETGSSYLANMIQPRANHCMETLGERLYVAGGTTTVHNLNIADQLNCEVYSPAADCWTAFTPLPVPHVGAGSTVLEGKFYVLGGYSQEDYSDTKIVHRYDAATQRWENMGKMPGPNNDIRASLLCLPEHFRL